MTRVEQLRTNQTTCCLEGVQGGVFHRLVNLGLYVPTTLLRRASARHVRPFLFSFHGAAWKRGVEWEARKCLPSGVLCAVSETTIDLEVASFFVAKCRGRTQSFQEHERLRPR